PQVGKTVVLLGTVANGLVTADTRRGFSEVAPNGVSPKKAPEEAMTQTFPDYPGFDDSRAFTGTIKKIGDGQFVLESDGVSPQKLAMSLAGGDGCDALAAIAKEAASGKRVAFLGRIDPDGKLAADSSGSFREIGAKDKVVYPNVDARKAAPEGQTLTFEDHG